MPCAMECGIVREISLERMHAVPREHTNMRYFPVKVISTFGDARASRLIYELMAYSKKQKLSLSLRLTTDDS